MTARTFEFVNKVRAIRGLDGTAKSILAYLADRADPHGVCFPGLGTIALDTGWNRATVVRALDRLEETGLITRFFDPARKSKSTRLTLDRPSTRRTERLVRDGEALQRATPLVAESDPASRRERLVPVAQSDTISQGRSQGSLTDPSAEIEAGQLEAVPPVQPFASLRGAVTIQGESIVQPFGDDHSVSSGSVPSSAERDQVLPALTERNALETHWQRRQREALASTGDSW
jgi:DNA-binding transcriptional ArsR family regulator